MPYRTYGVVLYLLGGNSCKVALDWNAVMIVEGDAEFEAFAWSNSCGPSL